MCIWPESTELQYIPNFLALSTWSYQIGIRKVNTISVFFKKGTSKTAGTIIIFPIEKKYQLIGGPSFHFQTHPLWYWLVSLNFVCQIGLGTQTLKAVLQSFWFSPCSCMGKIQFSWPIPSLWWHKPYIYIYIINIVIIIHIMVIWLVVWTPLKNMKASWDD